MYIIWAGLIVIAIISAFFVYNKLSYVAVKQLFNDKENKKIYSNYYHYKHQPFTKPINKNKSSRKQVEQIKLMKVGGL